MQYILDTYQTTKILVTDVYVFLSTSICLSICLSMKCPTMDTVQRINLCYFSKNMTGSVTFTLLIQCWTCFELPFCLPEVVESLEAVRRPLPCSSSPWSGRWRRRRWPRGHQRAPRPAWSRPPAPPGVWSSWWAPQRPGRLGQGYRLRSGSAPGRWWRWEPGWRGPGCSQPAFCPLREEEARGNVTKRGKYYSLEALLKQGFTGSLTASYILYL